MNERNFHDLLHAHRDHGLFIRVGLDSTVETLGCINLQRRTKE